MKAYAGTEEGIHRNGGGKGPYFAVTRALGWVDGARQPVYFTHSFPTRTSRAEFKNSMRAVAIAVIHEYEGDSK